MRYTHFLVTCLLIIMALPALGGANYLGGSSGIIYTPDDVIVPAGTWEASFHNTIGLLGGSDSDLQTVGLTYGLLPRLEIGASYIMNGASDVAVSGKYRLVLEGESTPVVTVGVFDLAGNVSSINGDPSFYVLVSKMITPLASDISGQPSKPLRMSLGVGSGFYEGIIVNLNWTLEPRLSLLAEYKGGSGGIDRLRNRPSAGLRWAATDSLRLDAAAVGFRDFGFGVSFRNAF